MAKTSVGVRGFVIADQGTLNSSFTNVIQSGVHGNTSMVVSDHKQKEDSRKRMLRNQMNVKIETALLQGETNEGDLYLLQKLTEKVKAGAADVAVVGMESVWDAEDLWYEGDVYKFSGDNALGIGFEYTLNPDGRDAKVNLEAALPYSVFQTINTAAKTETLGDIGNGFNTDFTKVANPVLLAAEFASAEKIFNLTDIKDYSISFKTEGDKANLGNRDQVDWILAEVMVEGTYADASKLEALLAKSQSQYLKLTLDADGYTENIIFAANTLTHSFEYTHSDDDRSIKINFKGAFPLTDFNRALLAGVASGTVTFNLY